MKRWVVLGLLVALAGVAEASSVQQTFESWESAGGQAFHGGNDCEPVDVSPPIGQICRCARQGAVACGCEILKTGSGECQFRTVCGSILRDFCQAISLELCVIQTVGDIISPFR